MSIESNEYRSGNNALAIVSMISSIVGWVLFVGLLCVNLFLLPLLALATVGVGLILYICVIPGSCLPPITWIVGIITGHISTSQIQTTHQSGDSMARAGLILGYIGLGLTILLFCAMVMLTLFGVSIPVLNEIFQELGFYLY